MANTLSVAEMQANVALSQGHVSKQEVIIARLTDQGHEAMAGDARAVLVTMHAHLASEVEIRVRMERALRQA